MPGRAAVTKRPLAAIPFLLWPAELRVLARLMQFPRVVIPHRGARICVRGGLLHVPQRDPASSAAVMNAWRSV
jgi:hypothetical protein